MNRQITRRWATRAEDRHGEPHHYFASSVAEWATDTDLESLLKRMKRESFPFAVYRVKLPETAGYKIESYRPVVDADKLTYVGFWDPA